MLLATPEWLNHVPMPTFWAGIALLAGAMATYMVVRRFGPLQAVALENLVGLYEKQIEAHSKTLEMQKSHYENELGRHQAAEERIRDERDSYRNKLDTEKELHKATTLIVAELQARPSVDQVYAGQQEFFAANTKALEGISKSINDHDASIEERTKLIVQPVHDMCQAVVEALDGHKLRRTKTKP